MISVGSNNFLPGTQHASIQIYTDIFTWVTLTFLYKENNKCWEKHNFCLVLTQDFDHK